MITANKFKWIVYRKLIIILGSAFFLTDSFHAYHIPWYSWYFCALKHDWSICFFMDEDVWPWGGWYDCLKDPRPPWGWAEMQSQFSVFRCGLTKPVSYTSNFFVHSRFLLCQPLPDQHWLLREGCESAARLVRPSPESHDELASAAWSVWFLLKLLTDFIWKTLLCVASKQSV